MMTTILTRKNQITVPAEIVRALDLTPGTQFDWSIGPDGTLIGTPRPSRAQRAAALYGAGRKYLRPGSDPIRGLIAERLEDATLSAVLVHRDPHFLAIPANLLQQEVLPEKQL